MEKLDRIEQKIDKMREEHGVRLTTIEIDLRYHIKRTDELEDIVRRHEKYFWMAMGILALVSPAINLLLKFVIK